jgi:DNA-binding GntR family transcriptional regulator
MGELELGTRRSRPKGPARVAGGPAGTAIVHNQLWQATATRIRDEILSGDLPVGTKLNEVDLAERYGVSRVPVREALRALARTGVVVFVPRKGAFVSTPVDSDYEEVYLARDAIETAAVRAAVARVTAGRSPARRLRAAGTPVSLGHLELAWAADLQFHRRIFEIAGNGRLLGFDQLGNQTLLLHHHALGRSGPVPPPETLHWAIVDAAGRTDGRSRRSSATSAVRRPAIHGRITAERRDRRSTPALRATPPNSAKISARRRVAPTPIRLASRAR